MNNERVDDVRDALTRTLHEEVWAPGASYDRAAPKAQEYMQERADAILSRFDVTPKGQAPDLSAHVEGVMYADDIPEGTDYLPGTTDPIPEDYEHHYCEVDGEDWPCAAVRARASQPVTDEPTVEEWAARAHAARERAIAKGYTPEHDAEHGIRHLLNWAIDYARRGRAEDSAGLILSAIALIDDQPVTDEQVEAAARRWWEMDYEMPGADFASLPEATTIYYRRRARGALEAVVEAAREAGR